jgi:hypothetical protein
MYVQQTHSINQQTSDQEIVDIKMNTMAYTNAYGFDQSYDQERQAYFEPSIYHPDAPLFTQQELSGFEPAQFNLVQTLGGGIDMDMSMGCCWQPEAASMKTMGMGMGYGDVHMVPQFFGGSSHETPEFGMDTDMDMGYAGVDFYGSATSRCFPEEMVGSCQPSPFLDQSRLPPFQQPISPVTPTGSPLQYGAPPPAFLLVPVENNGQYQYSAYQVPMHDFMAPPAYQDNGFESQHASPHTVPSLIASPLTREVPAMEEDDEEEDQEEEEEEEEDDRSVLPNCGNTELRGMGLYDDTPDLMFCPTPGGCSPVTPHDQIRPTLGKGLVLERSFGLPEKMMMKDEESGEIIEGKLQLDDDEYEEPMY